MNCHVDYSERNFGEDLQLGEKNKYNVDSENRGRVGKLMIEHNLTIIMPQWHIRLI